MIVPGQRTPIVMATRPVDFRRGHDGLAATVQKELGLDPHSGLTVVFRSRRGDRLKILVWDGTGLVLTYNWLERGRFVWPSLVHGRVPANPAQLAILPEGIDWRAPQRTWRPRLLDSFPNESSRRSDPGNSPGKAARL